MAAKRPKQRLANLTVHVVSHTHWDREWYQTASIFRQRLVRVIDGVIESASRDRSLHFLLDGQGVVLEDYLSVRPEKGEVLRTLLRRGQLEAGPWYVLGDELIPSGEALVRNLLAGRRVLTSLGARVPKVLYCPDSFGHPAALPTLAAGFGCDLIVIWRGFGGSAHPRTNAFIWTAADGSAVTTYHLPRSGYELGANLPRDARAAARRWKSVREQLVERDAMGVVMLPNGADHHALQHDYLQAIELLTHAAEPDRVVHSSLTAFARDLLKRSRSAALPSVTGELRDSYGYTWTLQGTFASRTHLKRLLAAATQQLVGRAEPWSALAAKRTGESSRHLVNAAWKPLLLSIPHDTICGCSIDAVAEEAALRLRDAASQGQEIARASIARLASYDATAVRDIPNDPARDLLLLANPVARRRGGVAEVSMMTKLRDVKVGPGSAVQPRRITPRRKPNWVSLAGDPTSARLPLQKLSSRIVQDRVESLHHYPDQDLVEETSALVWVPEIPGFGLNPLVSAGPRGHRIVVPDPATASGTVIGNGLVFAGVNESGRIWLSGADRSRRMHLSVEDQEDGGDLYTPSLRGTAAVVREARSFVVTGKGPLRSSAVARFEFSTAVENSVDTLNVTTGGQRRVRSRPSSNVTSTKLQLTVHMSIDAHSHVVKLVIDGVNTDYNHRLRLLISGDIRDASVATDAGFGPIFRAATKKKVASHTMEIPLNTHPLHRHVTILNRGGGLTLFAGGSPEYDYLRSGQVAVTLLRAVGELSLPNLPERPGNAGWPASTPGAQEVGAFTTSLAWMPHLEPDWDRVAPAVERAADDFFHPLHAITLRSAVVVPEPTFGVELAGDGLSVAAIKESEDGRTLVLRCVNVTSRRVTGTWRLGHKIRSAWLAKLDESRIRPLKVHNSTRIRFAAEPHAVTTILVK